MNQLNNTLTIPIIDRFGKKIDQRQLVNIPFMELYDDDVVFIDWQIQSRSYARPDQIELSTPIQYEGKTYYPAYGWGSAVKKGQTIGFTHDLPCESGMVKLVEDGQRVQRWLFAQGLYGGLVGKLKVGVLPAGSEIDGKPIEDGFGYIRRDIAEQAINHLGKINLGYAKGSYTFWQRVPWSRSLEKELKPHIDQRLVEMSDTSSLLYTQSSTFEEKQTLVDIDPIMIEHPYVANALSRSLADLMARVATTAPINSKMKLAVPSKVKKMCLPGECGDIVAMRYPIDSNGNIQIVNLDDEDKDTFDAESKRISSMEVIQYSLSSHDHFAKGCLGIVDDLPFDLVVCADDIKMSVEGTQSTRRRKSFTFDGVLAITQHFTAGSNVGVNAEWSKNTQGLDFDGDMEEVASLTNFPQLKNALLKLPFGETPKLEKSKRLIENGDHRSEMIVKSMSNLVGFASNVTSTTFMIKDRRMLADRLGYKSLDLLDKDLNYFIKVGTDGFKTDVDTRPIEKKLGIIQANVVKLFGGVAPWTKWPDDYAFRRSVPHVINQVNGNKYLVQNKWTILEKRQVNHAVKPFMDGTIAKISRLTLPALSHILDTPIRSRLLTEFLDWAPRVNEIELECARWIQDWFNANVKRVNFSDPLSIGEFKSRLNVEIDNWLSRENISRKRAAAALWRICHSSRSNNASGASVFIAFPEEAQHIVENKPGLKTRSAIIITGLHYQLPQVDNITTEVEIVDVELNNKIRKALVATVDGQRQPLNSSYPKNMIAMVAANSPQPTAGKYTASISKSSKSAWTCKLS